MNAPTAPAPSRYDSTSSRLLSSFPPQTHGGPYSSPRAGWEMLGHVPGQQMIQMHTRARTFKDAVSAVGIGHEVERFPEFDEFVHQQLRPLVVNVVVAGAVHNQQMALQSCCEIDCRTLLVALDVVLGQAHIAFLVDRVV